MTRQLAIIGLVLPGAVLAACANQGAAVGRVELGGPAGPVPVAPSVVAPSCTECHNDTNLIAGKRAAWEESRHGSGSATAYAGARAACAGCHSGAGFADRIAAGNSNPNTLGSADPNPSRPDCRACHLTHATFTSRDWALRTSDPVELYAVEGQTYSGGTGNLCANCHQPGRAFPASENGVIEGISTHWGPHHGPQSGMLLGVGGAGVEGTPGPHYSEVEDTCVGCHMGGDKAVHSFAVAVSTCQTCHPDAEDFDVNGVQSETGAMADELGELLLAAGLISENSEAGYPTVAEAPEAEALALYNWLYVTREDGSLGVHNPAYARIMLQAGLDAMR